MTYKAIRAVGNHWYIVQEEGEEEAVVATTWNNGQVARQLARDLNALAAYVKAEEQLKSYLLLHFAASDFIEGSAVDNAIHLLERAA